MDPIIHQLAEQGRFAEIDMTEYWPVYWFINGRAAPDTLAAPFVAWLPHQPYNTLPRMRPGENLLMRIVGASQGQHPFHFHGNNADIIARDGRMLTHPRSRFTTLSVPGQTVDQIFTWTGKGTRLGHLRNGARRTTSTTATASRSTPLAHGVVCRPLPGLH